MKNNYKTLFTLPLQFFANEESSDIQTNTECDSTGDASPETNDSSVNSSAETNLTGNQIEEEFEKLIKGGKYEDAFKKRTQGIIDKRFKTLKTLEETQAKQQPLLNFLSEKYGIDSSDTERLLQKMQEESLPKNENVKSNAEIDNAKKREQFLSAKANALYKRWTIEGEKLKKTFPDFDFKKELSNPTFSSLLKSGVPLHKAYTAAHSDELIKNAVEGTAIKVAEQTLKSIRTQGSRVAENGLHSGAGFVRKTDISSLSGEEIRNIIKQVENGSKIRF